MEGAAEDPIFAWITIAMALVKALLSFWWFFPVYLVVKKDRETDTVVHQETIITAIVRGLLQCTTPLPEIPDQRGVWTFLNLSGQEVRPAESFHTLAEGNSMCAVASMVVDWRRRRVEALQEFVDAHPIRAEWGYLMNDFRSIVDFMKWRVVFKGIFTLPKILLLIANLAPADHTPWSIGSIVLFALTSLGPLCLGVVQTELLAHRLKGLSARADIRNEEGESEVRGFNYVYLGQTYPVWRRLLLFRMCWVPLAIALVFVLRAFLETA